MEDRLIAVFNQFGMIDVPDSQTPTDMETCTRHLSKAQLFKCITELGEAFLGMQAIAAGPTLYYLNFVIGTLFELANHSDQDMRMAADETINQIIKVRY